MLRTSLCIDSLGQRIKSESLLRLFSFAGRIVDKIMFRIFLEEHETVMKIRFRRNQRVSFKMHGPR